MASTQADFYRGKRVLVTGHTGFKGAWLASWLKMLGARVVGVALPPEPDRPSLFQAADVANGMHSVMGDIRDRSVLATVLKDHSPEIVFHLAAQSLVRRSYREPVETYATNVMGTAHLLEAVRQSPSVRAVVVVTSDKCYENREWPHGYRESDPLGGRDPYSSSKGCAEIVTAAYRASFFGPDAAAIASARAGNVIGGGDWAEDRLIPDLFRGLAAGEPVIIRNPGATRPWQHVLEPLRGYLLLGERLWNRADGVAEAWNFGPPDQNVVPVLELARSVLRYWGGGNLRVEADPSAPHEAHFLRLDWGKARAGLGWQPFLTFDETVRLTVEWYRAYHDDSSAASGRTRQQIEWYAARLPAG